MAGKTRTARSEPTTAVGSQFRSIVAALLRSRYGDAAVEQERLLKGNKAADIVFKTTDVPGMQFRIAVECKKWDKPLQAKDIRSIRSDYLDAHNAGEIQGLYIIAPHDISASVKATVADIAWLTFMTLEQFHARIIDFSSYLSALNSDFSRDGLNTYYVPSRLDDGSMLHTDVVVPWLTDNAAKPIAIVAGYGMGKTTYSRFLAHTLASVALTDNTAHIPILIPLGAIVQQQSIRSLISYLFADQYRVPGYSYQLFDALNSAGRFVLIFDAFDEMKHAMNASDIKHNLEEIKTLILPNTKAILIGRPDPFTSDDEFSMLGGRVKIIGRLAATNRLAAFDIKYLDYFNSSELESFMFRYMTHFLSGDPNSHGAPSRLPRFIAKRIKQMKESKHYELARRPVQAKMIAELWVSDEFDEDETSIYSLYQHFVSYVMEREVQKSARSKIGLESRLSFLRAVAWWLWNYRNDGHFTFAELPRRILEVISDRRGTSSETLVRELLIGSLLDRRTSGLMEAKGIDHFYFAHKSYWEFLVADYISHNDLTEQDIRLLSRRMSVQLVEFLDGIPSIASERLYRRLVSTRGPVHLKLFEVAARSDAAQAFLETDFSLIVPEVKVTSSEALMLCITLAADREGIIYTNWEVFLFQLAQRAEGVLAGLAVGLLHWASADEPRREQLLAVLVAICAGGVASWVEKVDRYNQRGIAWEEIESADEATVFAFFSNIEDVNNSVLSFNCKEFCADLARAQLCAVDETSLEIKLGSVQVESQEIDRLEGTRAQVNYLSIIRRGNTLNLRRLARIAKQRKEA